jgi:hypothetical protein
MIILLIILMVGVFFYLLIPGLGAVYVRRKWRYFRKKIITSRYYPLLTKIVFFTSKLGDRYRFFGALEGIEEDEIVWLQGEGIRIPVNMADEEVYILPGHPLAKGLEADFGNPKRIPWSQLAQLAEGTQFFVFGELVQQGQRLVLGSGSNEPLFAVIYEGSTRDFVSWTITTGRQLNEYWNGITPFSLITGALLYLILTLTLINLSVQGFWISVTLLGALLPFLPLFPPGVGLYFIYRRLWRRAREFRAMRDLLALPLLYFLPPDEHNHQGGYRVVKHIEQMGANFPKRVLLPSGKPLIHQYLSPNDIHESLKQGAFLRSVQLLQQFSYGDLLNSQEVFQEYQWFTGFGTPDTQGHILPPDDPMAEFVIIPGDVDKAITQCQNQANKREVLGLGILVFAFMSNVPLIGWILFQLVRMVG